MPLDPALMTFSGNGNGHPRKKTFFLAEAGKNVFRFI